jgi:hypothetical protein
MEKLERERANKPIIRSFAAKRARNRRCRGMARSLLKLWPALWTFAAHQGVQPTNNHAEVFAYLTDVLAAHARGDPVPLLA